MQIKSQHPATVSRAPTWLHGALLLVGASTWVANTPVRLGSNALVLLLVVGLVAQAMRAHHRRSMQWAYAGWLVSIGGYLLLLAGWAYAPPLARWLGVIGCTALHASSSIAALLLIFPPRTHWHGTPIRLIVDAVTVTVATTIMGWTVLTWAPPTAQAAVLAAVAGTTAWTYTIAVVMSRYGQHGGPLVLLLGVAGCGLCGHALVVGMGVLVWGLPAAQVWAQTAPLVTLHCVVLALGMTRAQQWDRPVAPLNSVVRPTANAHFWSLIPSVGIWIALVVSVVADTPAGGLVVLLSTALTQNLVTHLDTRTMIARHQATDEALIAWGYAIVDRTQRVLHDIGGPLRSMQAVVRHGNLDRATTQRHQRYVDDVQAVLDSVRLSTQSQQALRLITGATEVALDAVLAASVSGMEARAAARAVRIWVGLDPHAVAVYADPHATRRVLDNLLANAITAAPAASTVVVEARRTAHSIQIAVRDSGVGLSADQQATMFRPYVRYSGNGTGLGLSIVHDLVSAMRGTIDVVSVPHHGTSIWVTLPAVPPPPS